MKMFVKHSTKLFKGLFPPIKWIPMYNKETIICDIIAGITVGLTLIPQSIAYASLAGLSAEYGLYASLMGGFVYVVFGTCPQIHIAPTAFLSLFTYTYTHSAPFGAVNAAILLCFLSGMIELVCGLLHLGFLVDFVSDPVVSGFTSAGALTVGSSQVKNLLGLNYNAETFIDIWSNVIKNIKNIKVWDVTLSLGCCSVLLAMRYLKKYGIPPLNNDMEYQGWRKIFRNFLWFVSVSRNATVVIFCAVMAYVLDLNNHKPFSLTSEVTSGLPTFSLPLFVVTKNETTYSFMEMTKYLGTGILIVPFVAILSNVAIAKAFADGKVVDATQEMIAVGLCNLFGSFVSSMPVNASFSRGAVSRASGSKTTLAGTYSSIMVVMALTLLTPYFKFIPKATLGSVIVCAVIFMVDLSIIKSLWIVNKINLIPLLVTFVACLVFGIETGILFGIVLDALFILFYSSRPKLEVEYVTNDIVPYLKIQPHAGVHYTSVEKLREKIFKYSYKKFNNVSKVVIDCSHMDKIDYTSAKVIGSLSYDLLQNNKKLLILNANCEVEKIIKAACGNNCQIIQNEKDLQ